MSATRNETVRAQMLYGLRRARANTEDIIDIERAYELLVELIGKNEHIPPKCWAFVLVAYSTVIAKDTKW